MPEKLYEKLYWKAHDSVRNASKQHNYIYFHFLLADAVFG